MSRILASLIAAFAIGQSIVSIASEAMKGDELLGRLKDLDDMLLRLDGILPDIATDIQGAWKAP